MASLPLIAAGIVLIPGVHSWWTGRTLLARIADPAFPELLLARAQQRATVAVVAGAVAVPLAVGHWMWTVPLLIVAQLTGGFSFRKALFGEAWSLGEYIRFVLLSVAGAAGFWLVLGFAPRIVVAIVDGWEPARPAIVAAIIAAGFGALLMLWERHFPTVWLALHGGSPLERPDLRARLDDIVSRSTVSPAPTIHRFGAVGAYMMNAIALPSIRRPGVAFGDTLLELFDADEIIAVFAHEVAHLEHFNPRRLARLRLLTYVLIAGGVAVAIGAIAYVPSSAALMTMLWPVAVLAVLVQRVSQSQKHEAESDRRSAELMGDPEPMVRALTKLHHHSKLPRRWPYDFERSASHPSLARRIQALRASGQVVPEPAPAVEPTVLRSTTTGSYIVLDATRIYWLEGVAFAEATDAKGGGGSTVPAPSVPMLAALRERATSYRATAYAELVELRVAVTGFGRAIQVRDRAGKTSSTPLHAADVAIAQRALDLLDGQLATRGGHDWRRTTRLIAAVLALLLVGSLDFGWSWIPVLVALIAPSAWALAGAGALGAARAAVSALAGGGQAGPLSWVLGAMMVVVGGIACVAAWRWARSADGQRRKRMTHASLAMASALLLTGFQGYRTRLADVEWTTAPAEVIARFEPPGFGRGVMLSPSGARIAVQTVDPAHANPYDDEDAGSWLFTVSDIEQGGVAARRTIHAVAMTFVDDDRVLALRAPVSGTDSMDLVVAPLGADSSVTWRRRLPSIAAPMLDIDRSSGRWTIVGHDMAAGEMVVVRGALDSTAISVARSSYEVLGGRPLHAWPDGSVLSASVEMAGGAGRVMLSSIGVLPYEWTISRTRDGRRERIGRVPGVPDCTDDPGGAMHCVVVGVKGSTLWRIDDGATLLGALPRDFDLWKSAGPNRVVAVERGGGTLALVDVGAARGTLLSLADSGDGQWSFMMGAASAPGMLAALTTADGRSAVTLYRVR